MACFMLRVLVPLCLLSSALACSCTNDEPTFLQDIYCKANHVIQIKVLGSDEVGPDPSHFFSSWGERRYNIDIEAVFKNSSELNDVADKGSLYTSLNEGTCGVSLQVGTSYVMTSFVSGGKLRILLCDNLKRPVEQFTAVQLYNLRYRYAKGCRYCTIQYCQNQEECAKLKRERTSCIGNHDGLEFSCRDKYSVCTGWVFKGYRYPCYWSTRGDLNSCLSP